MEAVFSDRSVNAKCYFIYENILYSSYISYSNDMIIMIEISRTHQNNFLVGGLDSPKILSR